MMRILSPAKINLHLRVGPRAADGFHPILSWMCTVGLHDTIEMTAADEPGIRLKCDRPDLPVDQSNLIVRAAHALNPKLGAKVSLQKKIPIGGGLGGGSSNAAFALLGFNQLWNLNLSNNQLAAIASQLGSDVPFFLHGPSSICAGRGEIVTPILRPAPKHAVLFFPNLSMPTPAVYRKFDEMKLGSNTAIHHQPDWQACTKLGAADLLNVLINDLEAPAFSLNPELAELRSQIEQKIGQTVRMSGSGSTLFTLTDHLHDAERIVSEIDDAPMRAGVFELAPN
jgi:4-diphosphocytidyl-2-C-methyl-D-erythritol kinase